MDGLADLIVQFLSTLPARGATVRPLPPIVMEDISIHAPREGSDMQTVSQWATTSYFYPRSPRGERRCPSRCGSLTAAFLSTLPARGATRPPDDA